MSCVDAHVSIPITRYVLREVPSERVFTTVHVLVRVGNWRGATGVVLIALEVDDR
jgi:hypothetical protein